MSSNAGSLAMLLDGPMQSWGHSSRYERRDTALHPTRSGVFGLIGAALGIDKYESDECESLDRFASLTMTTLSLPRSDRIMQRLADYHTVTGYRRADGTVDDNATVQTRRHYLLNARFGVLLNGPLPLLEEITAALRNPRWGIWLGRKCCIPASPVLVTLAPDRATAWGELLRRTGHAGTEPESQFDRIIECAATVSGADMIEDAPVGYGLPIGERHAPRWIQRLSKSQD
jgi:CRISPR system Cascade subunit CasD